MLADQPDQDMKVHIAYCMKDYHERMFSAVEVASKKGDEFVTAFLIRFLNDMKPNIEKDREAITLLLHECSCEQLFEKLLSIRKHPHVSFCSCLLNVSLAVDHLRKQLRSDLSTYLSSRKRLIGKEVPWSKQIIIFLLRSLRTDIGQISKDNFCQVLRALANFLRIMPVKDLRISLPLADQLGEYLAHAEANLEYAHEVIKEELYYPLGNGRKEVVFFLQRLWNTLCPQEEASELIAPHLSAHVLLDTVETELRRVVRDPDWRVRGKVLLYLISPGLVGLDSSRADLLREGLFKTLGNELDLLKCSKTVPMDIYWLDLVISFAHKEQILFRKLLTKLLKDLQTLTKLTDFDAKNVYTIFLSLERLKINYHISPDKVLRDFLAKYLGEFLRKIPRKRRRYLYELRAGLITFIPPMHYSSFGVCFRKVIQSKLETFPRWRRDVARKLLAVFS